MILTLLPPHFLDAETVATLCRARWQVKRLIKRLKSLLNIDELRARKDSQLAALVGSCKFRWCLSLWLEKARVPLAAELL